MALPSPVFSPRKARHEIASRVVPLEDVEPPLMAGEQVAAETGPSEVLGSAHIDALAEDRYLIQIVHFEAPSQTSSSNLGHRAGAWEPLRSFHREANRSSQQWPMAQRRGGLEAMSLISGLVATGRALLHFTREHSIEALASATAIDRVADWPS
jgi:hypothetical protein